MKLPLVLLLSLTFFARLSSALNIIWVSDQLPINSGTSDNNGGTAGVFGSGPGPYADQGVISLLTGAGHTVTRFNPSDATPLGAIQVPASGQPILLMADRQTVGGYPIIATVISADIGVAGQLGPGDSISFEVVTPDAALAALRKREAAINAIEGRRGES